jgi:hypothetical protein
MNYFGHAAIAHEYRPDPTFVLGAMLPDLLHLSDEPLGLLEDTTLQEGIAFHHRTDAIFHSSHTFVSLCQEALAAARRVGVSKGPARGMTHLVVELCIDAKLAEVPAWQRAYLGALTGRPPDVSRRPRLSEGLDWLLSRGVALHNAKSDRLEAAIGVTLRSRPRLAPSPDELREALAAWDDLPERVGAALPELLTELAPLFSDGQGNARLVFGQHVELHKWGVSAPRA